jgi:hypothetical protein
MKRMRVRRWSRILPVAYLGTIGLVVLVGLIGGDAVGRGLSLAGGALASPWSWIAISASVPEVGFVVGVALNVWIAFLVGRAVENRSLASGRAS